jgi:hypothetical protein
VNLIVIMSTGAQHATLPMIEHRGTIVAGS